MVVGNGLIANAFLDYTNNDTCLVFASGVSNSGNTDPAAFNREKNLLQKMLAEHAGKTFIYFSTCSIYDPWLRNSPYVKHKLEMENSIARSHDRYHIFRISNLAGKTNNPHTVLNFFIRHILSGEQFYIWKKAYRNIIDVSDAYSICNHIIENRKFENKAVNIANPVNYPVTEIVHTIETISGKKGKYEFIDRESNPVIDIGPVRKIIAELAINFDENYLERTIKKYFPFNDL